MTRPTPGRGISPGRLLLLWLLLIGLAAGAYFALPLYMESLDRRIVFRQPDCMDVARERAESTPVEISERGDSLEAWMKACLEERQEEMARHADVVGYGTMAALITIAVILAALVTQTAFARREPSRDRTG